MDTRTPANPGRPVSPADLADTARRLKAIFVGSSGNLVEWFDFYTYSAFALYFAGSFFPGSDPVVQQLNAAILFAFGFIVRPIDAVEDLQVRGEVTIEISGQHVSRHEQRSQQPSGARHACALK